MSFVPCVYTEGLTEAQRRAYILADNRLAELATWDMDLVALELEDLAALAFDTSLIGFSDVDTEPIEFEPFDGAGDGGGSQISGGDKVRVVIGALMFDMPDPDHALYDSSRDADEEAVGAAIRGLLLGDHS